MKAGRIAIGAALVCGSMATVAGTVSASSIHDGIKWSSVAGHLTSYTPGRGAQVSLTKTVSPAARDATRTLKVALSLKTLLMYAKSKQAPPMLTTGDGVYMNLKWTNGAAHATLVSYMGSGSVPSSANGHGTRGTSRFHGTYDGAASSLTMLSLVNFYGDVDTFALTPNTVYFEGGQQVADPTLTNGQHIGVESSQQSDGSWAADTVVVGDHTGDRGGDGQNEQFGGLYQSATSGTLTVAGKKGHDVRTFGLDGNTRYVDQNGQVQASLAYTAGERLLVRATEQSDGTWLAKRVRAGASDGGEGQNHLFRGSFAKSTPHWLTMKDKFGNTEGFALSRQTMYFDATGNPVATLRFTAAQTLWITATLRPSGTWQATEINVVSPKTTGDQTQTEDFAGGYKVSTPTSLVIHASGGPALTFDLGAGTTYFDVTGAAVSGLTYVKNERLCVRATQAADGSWSATMVSAFTPKAGTAG